MRRIQTEDISAGMKLAQPVYGLNGQVILNIGAVIADSHIEKLTQMAVRYVYIDGEANLFDPNDCKAVDAKNEIVQNAHQALEEIRVGKYVETEQIKYKVLALLDECCMHKDIQPLFVAMQRCNDYLFKHAVCGYFFAMMLGLSMGIEGKRLRELGLGTLLRDVGMITISPAILNKPGSLTPEEMAIVKKHPEKGYELLQRNPDISLSAASCALQHHERYDGSGYPRGIQGSSIHEFAQIAAIADIYSSMTANTPYRRALTVYETLAIIEKAGAAYFNPAIIRLLVSSVAIYPLGGVVRLSNKSIGIVNDYADEMRTKPVLNLVTDEAGARINKTVTIDMEANPDLYIVEVS